MSRRVAWVAAAVLFGAACIGGTPVPAAAQEQVQEADPQDDRATAFRAVRGPEAEQVPGGTLLLAAYALVWVLLLLFVLRLAYLYAKTRRDMDALERRMDEGASHPPPE